MGFNKSKDFIGKFEINILKVLSNSSDDPVLNVNANFSDMSVFLI